MIHCFGSIGFCSNMQQLKHIKIEFELNELNWTERKRERGREMCEYTEKSVMLRACAGEGPSCECSGMTGRD